MSLYFLKQLTENPFYDIGKHKGIFYIPWLGASNNNFFKLEHPAQDERDLFSEFKTPTVT